MKVLSFFIIFCIALSPAYSITTDASKYAEKKYASLISVKKVKINVKKEHSIKYEQSLGKQVISVVKYGYGDIKIQGCKKGRITYTVMYDCCCKPFWSSVYYSEQ